MILKRAEDFKFNNMFKIRLINILVLIIAVNIAIAQPKKSSKAKVESSPAELLYEDMLESTARIMFIDSVVVAKNDFLKHIPLGKEAGRVDTYDNFLSTTGHDGAYMYMNEFGNKAFLAKTDDNGKSQLYESDRLGGQWSQPKLITDFGEEFEDINYPFMMADGVTLYFSAKNADNLGGYDIYVTTYDTDSAKFYIPENIGLPYNSHANDYYCLIDEYNTLGWLVTDRRQAADSVCIYTFVPSAYGEVYDADNMDESMLRNLADITSIKSSQNDASKLQEAKKQLDVLLRQREARQEELISFVVNDEVVYTKTEQFKSAANRERYNKLCSMKADVASMQERLDQYREKYMEATADKKKLLGKEILKMEESIYRQNKYVSTLEKEIRNAENLAMQNN